MSREYKKEIYSELEKYFDKSGSLSQIDLSDCEVLSSGYNGVIYKLSDEMIAKKFLKKPDYETIVRERTSQKNALIYGIPAPISFGYAENDGKIVLLMELINSESLATILCSKEDIDEYVVQYVQLIKGLHNTRSEDVLNHFPRSLFGNEILTKADRIDSVLPEKYRGKARIIIESIDEPECLVHGDIQPGNVMLSNGEMVLIDFETFSTGKAIYDIGAFYRNITEHKKNLQHGLPDMMPLSVEKYKIVWDLFIEKYFEGETEDVVRKKLLTAKIICYVLSIAKSVKIGKDIELVTPDIKQLEEYIDEFENIG